MKRAPIVVVGALAATFGACDAALDVLQSGSSSAPDGGDAAGDDAAERDGDAPADGGLDGTDASDGWPGPPGTVVPIATGLVGAIDIDVDETYVYVLVGDFDGGLHRVPKRGGSPETVAPHQVFPTSVRATSRAVAWTVAPGDDPDAGSVYCLPRDGGPPQPLVVGATNAGQLAADGDRIAWVDHTGAVGRVMIAELDKGNMRPIAQDQLGVGGLAFDGDRLAWTAHCASSSCSGYVMSSSIAAPAPAPVWSTPSDTNMLGIVLNGGTIAFAYDSSGAAFLERLPAGSSSPTPYGGASDVRSALRNDGPAFVFLASDASGSLAVTRARADGTAAPATLASSTGTRGGVAPDGPAIYWISAEEGVLRAVAR